MNAGGGGNDAYKCLFDNSVSKNNEKGFLRIWTLSLHAFNFV